MSMISNYIRMDSDEIDKEIEKQKKKLVTAQETIELLGKLKIVAKSKDIDSSEKTEK